MASVVVGGSGGFVQAAEPTRPGIADPVALERLSRALKFRLGGRTSRNADPPPGRTERLIPLVRETFPDFALYADSNSSYDVPNALRIGRMMEEDRYGFFEEPVPFDDL